MTARQGKLLKIAVNLGTVFTVAAVMFAVWQGNLLLAFLLMLCLIWAELVAIRRAIVRAAAAIGAAK